MNMNKLLNIYEYKRSDLYTLIVHFKMKNILVKISKNVSANEISRWFERSELRKILFQKDVLIKN